MVRVSNLQTFYSDTFPLPLPDGHRFPGAKYRILRERVQRCAGPGQLQLRIADAASNEQLLLVHTAEYLQKLQLGTLSPLEQRRIGFPWSPEMVERSRRSTGATIAAARAALSDGAGIHLAGGTHHAFADHGQGFCVFNDVAVAIRVLQVDGLIQNAVVIDLDVHQGNGTAAIFAEDPRVFTFSMHGAENFPFSKCNSDLDISLPTGTDDVAYLDALCDALIELPWAEAEIAFYLAGADCFAHDRFGKLKLTKQGLAQRDRLVFDACLQHRLPVTLTMAGGYAEDVEDIVDISWGTIEALLQTRAAQ